ncbi:MAG: SAM-dependent methyltransferase [Bernardetiaceae bacterium]|nr:SAM-dependent methyltransferase [Bernardetiaceae bacterium]
MKLYLVPVPISAKASVSPEIKEIMPHITHFFVENLRSARRFIASLKLQIVIDNLVFYEIGKGHTQEEIIKNWAALPKNNVNIALLSEAGAPCVADPGAFIVELAHKSGAKVLPMVGASSFVLALMASGMNGQSFAFHGYLPIQTAERKKILKKLENESRSKKQTQIFMETPFRNQAMIKDMIDALQPNTRLCIAADITGEREFVYTKNIKEWKLNMPNIHKIPAVFVLAAY